jgi:cell division protein FtsB
LSRLGSPGRAADRAADRPVRARQPGAGGHARRTVARPPRRLGGRATVLGLVLIALALAYAYPIRVYLAQQAEIERMQQAQEDQRQRIAALGEQLAKWDDPEYVRTQARRRLHYVKPGEVAYVIVEAPQPAVGNESAKARDTGPWYDQLWSTIQAADGAPTG